MPLPLTLTRDTRLLLTMTAQVVISTLFIGGYFLLLREFMLGHVKVPPEYRDMFIALIGVLTAGVGTILSFWFQRVRSSVDAPPPHTPQATP